MDTRNIMPDPCDNRIIRFNNCIQLLSCVLDIAAIFVPALRDAAHILHHIADFVFWTTVGCMTAQTSYELDHTPPQLMIMWDNTLAYGPPTALNMKRHGPQQPAGPNPGSGYVPPQQQPVGNPTSMAAPMPQTIMVTVPQGVIAGQTLLVNHPTNGAQMQVTVPQGLVPGQQFAVQC
jgi:hypothetical protein